MQRWCVGRALKEWEQVLAWRGCGKRTPVAWQCTVRLTTPMVEWGSVWAGIEGLPRVLVLFVDRGVRPFPPPGWSASHSLQSSSPIFGFQFLQKMSRSVILKFPILNSVLAQLIRKPPIYYFH